MAMNQAVVTCDSSVNGAGINVLAPTAIVTELAAEARVERAYFLKRSRAIHRGIVRPTAYWFTAARGGAHPALSEVPADRGE